MHLFFKPSKLSPIFRVSAMSHLLPPVISLPFERRLLIFLQSFSPEMTKGSKFGAASGASGDKAVVEEKGKRSHFCTMVGMDFDPRTTKLHIQMLTNTWRDMVSASLLESGSNSASRILNS